MDYILISVLILNIVQLVPDAINTITSLHNFRSDCCGGSVSWDGKGDDKKLPVEDKTTMSYNHDNIEDYTRRQNIE